MTVLGALLSGIGYKNPVPSVLTQQQFDEAAALCERNAQNTEILHTYYTQLADGHWHLRYMTQNIPAIIKTIHEQQKKKGIQPTQQHFFETAHSFDTLPYDIFETYLLGALQKDDYKQAEQAFLLRSAYTKTDAGYVKTEPADFVSKEDLYSLKELFDSITFAHPGIGAVQKPQQKAHTLRGIRFFFILLPFIMLCGGIFYALRFKVTPETHAVILAEIDRLDAGGRKEDVTPETKTICELLTGIPYAKIRTDV